jgi:hypothetical protein
LQRDIIDSIAAQHGLIGGPSAAAAAAPKDNYYADAAEDADTSSAALDELLRMARQLTSSALARLVDAAKSELDKQ